MSEVEKDYELKVLKMVLNTYLDEIASAMTEEGLKSLEANRDRTVWNLATKIYSQSGHKVDLYSIRKLVDSRIEGMKHQVAADKERRAEEARQDEERRAEEARRRDAIKAFVPARVQKIVSEQLQVDENKVNLDSHLVKDLGMDEVAWVNLSMELEEEFDIEIPNEIVEDGWITIKNLVNLIQKILLA